MRIFCWSVLMMIGMSCGNDSGSSTGVAGAPSSSTGANAVSPRAMEAGKGSSPLGGAQAPATGSAGNATTGSSGMTSGGKAGIMAVAPATGASGTTTPAGTAGTGPTTAVAGTGVAGMTASAGVNGGSSTGTMPAAASCGPAATITAENLGNPMMKGPWTPTMKASSGPSGSSTLFYPTELGKDGVTHPVFHWGCGAGSQPSQYADHLNLLASYGFVVIANASGSSPSKASLDWILAENDKMGSMFFKKLDPERVAMGGHSLGALETMSSAKDPRIKTYILVCGGCMSGKGGCGAADFHAPSVFLGGEGEGGTNNFKGDYAEVKSPSVFVTKTDTDHIACARNNLGPWVAFMRWNLCGETQWQKEFMPGGTYCKSPWLDCMSKNF